MCQREVSDRESSVCEEPKVGCAQVVFVRSQKRLQSPSLSFKTHQWGKEKVLPTEACGCILEGLSLMSVSIEDRTRQLWSYHASPHPCHENMGKTGVQYSSCPR